MAISLEKQTIILRDRDAIIDNATLVSIFVNLGETPPDDTSFNLYIERSNGSRRYLDIVKPTDKIVIEFKSQEITDD